MTNSTELGPILLTTDDNDAVESATRAAAFRQVPATMSTATKTVGLVTGVAGTCANGMVLVVLLLARRRYGSHVNTLIANQSAMDLFACIFLAISCGMALPQAPANYLWLGDVANNLLCAVFRNRALAIVCLNAEKIGLWRRLKIFACRSLEKIGLVVITLERYFMVVHAIAHRKYYRNWMTSVGVAVPWISGIFTFVIPTIISTRSVPGQCPRKGFWPSSGLRKVSTYRVNTVFKQL